MADPVYTPFYVLCPCCPALHGPMRGRDIHAFVCECEGGTITPSPFKFSPYAQPRIVGYGSHRKALSPAQRAVADRLLGLSAPVGDYAAWDRTHAAVTSSRPARVGAACLPSGRELHHPHASLDLSHAA
jgi:hypothetical protein